MRRTERERLLASLLARVDLVDRVRRALEVAGSDVDAVRVVADALSHALDGQVRLVLTEGSNRTGEVVDVDSCAAYRRTSTTVIATSAAYDACPHLRAEPGPVSGVCLPIAAADHQLGVVQWVGRAGAPLDEVTVGAVETVVHMLGARLAVVRDAADDERPGTDPLTDVLNRRSTTVAIRHLVRDLVPFSLAVCDLDDFGAYNEDHGHDAGDRALRLFSHALTSTVRPDDVVGRTGGDRFTIAFPDTSALDAANALERVREVLVLALSVGDLPSFTVTCGVSDSNQGDSIEAIVDTAERAVEIGKGNGANRVLVAGEETASRIQADDPASDQGWDGL